MNVYAGPDVDAPYPGLRPFRQEESLIFFGRDEQIDEVLSRLKNHRFLGIVGLSGCGKSSLIRAGILPALESGLMGELGANWYIADMKPGSAPMANLAEALVRSGALHDLWTDRQEDLAMLTASLGRSDRSLVNLISQVALPPFTNLLILVDQFEEIFRFEQQDPDEALAFVNLLVTTCKDRSVSIYVVITMRSDFLGQCARFPILPETLNDSLYLCPSPTRSQLADAIRKPAELFGGHVEDSLVTKIINDVRASADMLPLIQHLLARMWYAAGSSKSVEPRILRLRDYRQVGGLNGVSPIDSVSFSVAAGWDTPRPTGSGNSGTHRSLAALTDVFQNALSEHADEAYFELCDQSPESRERGSSHKPSPQQKIAEFVFRCLAERAPSGQYIRRPVRIRDIASIADCSTDEVRAVVELFRRDDRCFLLPAAPISLEDDTSVDIIHEALIRQWQRFGGTRERLNDPDATKPWLAKEELCRQRYRRLAEASENEPFAGLLHDPELGFLNEWWQSFLPTAAWAQVCSLGPFEQISDFLARSLAADVASKARLEGENRLRVQQAEAFAKNMKRRFELIALCGLLVLILSGVATWLTFYAWKAQHAAQVNTENAETARKRAEQLAYAGTLASAQLQWEWQHARQAWDHLDAAQWDLRGWEHDYLFTLFQQGHDTIVESSTIFSIALTPDGQQIITGCADGSVSVWDIASRSLLRTLAKHDNSVKCICITPDGKSVFSGGLDKCIIISSTNSELPLRRLDNHDTVECLALSPDGKQIISGSSDNIIRIWDVDRAALIKPLDGHQNTVNCLAVSPDGRYLVSGSDDHTVKIWEANGGEFIRTIVKDSAVRCLAITRDSQQIVCGQDDGYISICSMEGNNKASSKKTHARTINSLTLIAGDSQILTGSNDDTIKFSDVANRSVLRTYVGHTKDVNCVAIHPTSGHVVSGGSDGTIKIWHKPAENDPPSLEHALSMPQTEATSPNGEYIATIDNNEIRLQYPDGRVRRLKGHSGTIICLAFNQISSKLATGSKDDTIKVWDISTGQELLTLTGHASEVACVAFSPEDNRIFSGGDDNVVKVWNENTGQETMTLQGHSDTVNTLVVRDGGQRIESGSKDGTTKIWNASSNQKTRTIKAHAATVASVAVSPNGKQIASAGADATINLWDATTGQRMSTCNGHAGPIKSVAFSPDSQRVVSGSDDQTIMIWDVVSEKPLYTVVGHEAAVNSVAFSPDGKHIVSGSSDHSVIVWNSKSRSIELKCTGHEDAVRCVCFSRDGRIIASSGDDRTIRIWDAKNAVQMEILKTANTVRCVAFSPDTEYIYSGDDGNNIYKWSIRNTSKSTTFVGHTASVLGLAISSDGNTLFSASQDQNVKEWDTASGELLHTHKGHLGIVTSVASSPSGEHIITSSDDKTIKRWEVVGRVR